MQEKINEMARTIDELLVEKPKEVTKHAMNVATYLFDRGYRKQEWISVDDSLPEENGRYLVNVHISHLAFGNLFMVAIMGYNKIHGFDENRVGEKVTHWMPLPEPPKMKGGAE